jgi:uncharacterized membrane protein (DUF485 family)
MSDSENAPPAESPKEAWDSIAERKEFHDLLSAKSRFIIPMCIFFLTYYFALPLLVGLAPDLMEKKVWGTVNVAYVFALSQFFMTWIVAIVYAKVAGKFDARAHELIKHLDS